MEEELQTNQNGDNDFSSSTALKKEENHAMKLFFGNKKKESADFDNQQDRKQLDLEKNKMTNSFSNESSNHESGRTNKNKKNKLMSTYEKFLPELWQKILFWVLSVLLILVGFVSALGVSLFLTLKTVQADGMNLLVSLQESKYLLSQQNLPELNNKLSEVKDKYQKFSDDYQNLTNWSFLPSVGKYISDGQILLVAGEHGLAAGQELITAVLPYADLLGFAGEGSFEGGTTEDRIKLIIETLGEITPSLEVINTELTTVEVELAKIDPNHYPEKMKDYWLFNLATVFKSELKNYADFPLRQTVKEYLGLADEMITTFRDYRPMIELLPEILGGDGETRKYLVLFQNDNELRPTGGFLTAYAIINVQDGKIVPEKSDDIYELDQKFNKKIEIPEVLGKYLTTEKYWHLRDMNIDPDFKDSMTTFLSYYSTVSGEPEDIDAIVAIDTKVLTDLIDVLGPVEVPGYGTFSTELDGKYHAPQIVIALSEIITKPTAYIRNDRKGVLGPMMSAILSKAYSAPKEQMADLVQAMLADLEGRHIQVYFLDEEIQAAAEKVEIAGRMIAPVGTETDFLAIVDANLGGAKSNLFINYGVVNETEAPENGVLSKKVTITYQNTQAGDNCDLEAGQLCLNATNNDWQRIYLPAGAKLVKAQGYQNTPSVTEENGLTVIDGYFALAPEKTAKIVLEYTIPYTNDSQYNLEVWKQGGVDEIEFLMSVNGGEEEIKVVGDTLYSAEF